MTKKTIIMLMAVSLLLVSFSSIASCQVDWGYGWPNGPTIPPSATPTPTITNTPTTLPSPTVTISPAPQPTAHNNPVTTTVPQIPELSVLTVLVVFFLVSLPLLLIARRQIHNK